MGNHGCAGGPHCTEAIPDGGRDVGMLKPLSEKVVIVEIVYSHIPVTLIWGSTLTFCTSQDTGTPDQACECSFRLMNYLLVLHNGWTHEKSSHSHREPKASSAFTKPLRGEFRLRSFMVFFWMSTNAIATLRGILRIWLLRIGWNTLALALRYSTHSNCCRHLVQHSFL